MSVIFHIDYSQKELQSIAMRKRMGWMLLILMCAVAAYGYVVMISRTV